MLGLPYEGKEDIFSSQASFGDSENNFGNTANQMQTRPLLQYSCRRRMSGNPLHHPHTTHVMFIPHFGAGFIPPIMLGMYDVEELVLAAPENLLVSHLCKETAFAFLRHIKELVCI